MQYGYSRTCSTSLLSQLLIQARLRAADRSKLRRWGEVQLEKEVSLGRNNEYMEYGIWGHSGSESLKLP